MACHGAPCRAASCNVAEYLLLRSGPLANNIFESAAFVKSVAGLDKPDIQLVFQPARRPSPKFPYPIGHGFAISPVGLYPRSRGRVTLASADPFAAPLVDPNLLSAPEDLKPLIDGIRLARKIFAAPAFARYQAEETSPGSAVQSDAELEAYIRAEAYTVHHPVSTCRMGTHDAGADAAAVVDAQLRVIGLDNLRVADASVFPSLIGGNTNAAVVMIAEKASDMILGRPPLQPENFTTMNTKPSAAECIEIERACERIIYAYSRALDLGDMSAAADFFAENGSFARPMAPTVVIQGREAIRAALLTRPKALLTKHVATNVMIDVESRDEARGHSYLTMISTTPPAGADAPVCVSRPGLLLRVRGSLCARRRRVEDPRAARIHPDEVLWRRPCRIRRDTSSHGDIHRTFPGCIAASRAGQ